MNLIERLVAAKQANLIVVPSSAVFRPTAYLGEDQVQEVAALVGSGWLNLEKDMVGEPLILGMRLVEVKRKDYLRVA